MSCTIDRNYLARLAGNYTGNSAARPSAPRGSDFLSTTARLLASENRAASAVPETADRSMAAYQQRIREKISQMPLSATRQMESISVQISDAAFERMKNDPSYEAWVLKDLREAFSQTNPWVPMCGGGYTVFYAGETKEQCRAEGWYPGYMGGQGASLFAEKSKGSFWEQRMERHKEFTEMQEKAAAKRRMLTKLHMNGGSVSAAELLMGLL